MKTLLFLWPAFLLAFEQPGPRVITKDWFLSHSSSEGNIKILRLSQRDAVLIRAHFKTINLPSRDQKINLIDKRGRLIKSIQSSATNSFSPWIVGNTLVLKSINSTSGTVNVHIDYIEVQEFY